MHNAYLIILQLKHKFWELKRTVSMRCFFWELSCHGQCLWCLLAITLLMNACLHTSLNRFQQLPIYALTGITCTTLFIHSTCDLPQDSRKWEVLIALLHHINVLLSTVEPVLSGHSKRRPKLVFKTEFCLIQVKSIAECSKGSILQYFRPSLSYHLS